MNDSSSWKCICGRTNPAGAQFCPNCGHPQLNVQGSRPDELVIDLSRATPKQLANRASYAFTSLPATARRALLLLAFLIGGGVAIKSVADLGWPGGTRTGVLRAARDAVREVAPPGVNLSFPGGETVMIAIHKPARVWGVHGIARASNGTQDNLIEYQCAVIWQGFPGRYRLVERMVNGTLYPGDGTYPR